MKISHIIPVLSILLFALHGAGIARSLHNLSHHTQPSITHSCNDANNYSTPINQAPSEQPTDTDDDHDCDICLTLSSITPVQSDSQPGTLTNAPKDNFFRNTAQELANPVQLLGDHAARAPPIC